MRPNKDLYMECNDQGTLSAKDFEDTFCKVCKNRECVRSGWAFSTWDKRILTQVDRLLVNPNIVDQNESMDWREIANFEVFQEPEKIEVWGGSPPPQAIIISEPPPPKEETKSEPVAPQTPPQEPTYEPLNSSPPSFNTSSHEIILGSGPLPPPTPQADPWAVTNTVKVGGKFKMGG
jgi:hypothetical protein